MRDPDPLCPRRMSGECACALLAAAREDERARTLDDVAASVRAYFREHGWEASDHGLIEWLDNTATTRKDTP